MLNGRKMNNCIFKIMGVIAMLSYSLLPILSNAAVESEITEEGFSWTMKSNLVYDSNVFRAPSVDYTDFAPAAGPVQETPTVQDGSYLQFSIKPNYRKILTPSQTLDTKIKFHKNYYTEQTTKQASTYNLSAAIGDNIVLRRKKKKRDSLYLGIIVGHVDRLYLDRDTGEQKIFGGTDISERYTYDFSGIKFKLKLRTTAYKYDFVFKLKQSNFTNVANATEMVYDNQYTLLGAKVKIPLNRTLKLSIAYNYYHYLYNHPTRFRKSRDSNGTLDGNLDPREYDYHRLKFSLRNRLSKKWLAYFDYEYTIRLDLESTANAEYDNYNKNKIKFRIINDLSPRVEIKYSLSLWQRDYPNAYAFDNPTQGKKEYSGEELRIVTNIQSTKKRGYIIDFRYQNDDSSDIRYDYDRIRFGVGIEWKS